MLKASRHLLATLLERVGYYDVDGDNCDFEKDMMGNMLMFG